MAGEAAADQVGAAGAAEDLAEAAGAPDNISMIIAECEVRKGKERT